MKYYILKKLTHYLTQFEKINHIKRVENNTIKIEFNDRKNLYFNMTKGSAFVYIKESKDINKKIFNAPFDVVLQKRFNNSNVQKVYLRNDDKVLNIVSKSKSSYKEQTTILQLEFTGKNTNIVILDEKDIVLEALRHIDEWTSTRVVKVGSKLDELQKPDFNYEHKEIDDIEQYLIDVYNSKLEKELENIKKQKIGQLKKQIIKIEKILKNLDDVEQLENKSIKLNEEAVSIVSQLYSMNGYEKNLNIKKSNDLFRDSKKAKAKAKNQYIEQLNLSQKLDFYKRLIDTVQKCENIDELEFYFPKKDKNQIKTKKQHHIKAFLLMGLRLCLDVMKEKIYIF